MGLKQRLYVVLLGVMLCALLVGVASLMALANKQAKSEDQQRLLDIAELVVQDIVFANITDDLARLDQRLHIYVQQQFLKEARWNSPQGNHLVAQSQSTLTAPEWFVQFVNFQPQVLRQQVVWFGKGYGELVLTSDVAASVNHLWSLTQYWLWIILGLLFMIVLSVEALVQPSIRQVQRLAAEATRLGSGQLDAPIAVAGHAEFITLSRSMENMRAAFLASVNQQQQQGAKLKAISLENEQRHRWLKSLLNNMRVAVLLEDPERRVVFANQLYCDFFRIALEPTALKDDFGARLEQQTKLLFVDSENFISQSERLISARKAVNNQLFHMQDGRWLMRDFVPIVDEIGRIGGHFWMYQDVTDIHLLRQTLADERDLAQVTLSSIGDGVITTDLHGMVTFINAEATRVTGWTLAQARGLPIVDVFKAAHEGEEGVWLDPVSSVLATGEKIELSNHTLLYHKSLDKPTPIEDSVAPILDRLGRVIGAVLVFHDVSDKYALEQSLRWQATHDALTQLIGRQEFERLLHQAQEKQGDYALIYLDLDQFKLVNDTAGHLAGDELLRQVTDLFKANVNERHLLARMGGDEFAVLVTGNVDEAMQVAEGLRMALAGLRYQYLGRVYQISVSIGVVPDIGAQPDMHMLMAMADAACYAAKNAGRNRVWLYQDSDAYLVSQQAEMALVSDLHDALANNRFELHAQKLIPLQSSGTERGLHCEVLIRLRDVEGNLVSPAVFIPAAENYGLIYKIDRWVIEQTLKLLGSDADMLSGVSVCSINLSGQSFAQADLVEFITKCMRDSGVPGHKLCFEVTETAAVSQLSQVADFIRAMRTLGCQFALDDFGSGQSSFRYLKHLPVNYLKIDGSFVQDMLQDKMNEALVRGMYEIAHSLGMQTVVEFVETAEVANSLRDIGVDYAQGWHFHRAQPMQDVLQALTQ
jgi:diguanylate cyclase (GGDEF)-like protein/PAS domain S-box-containing protein